VRSALASRGSTVSSDMTVKIEEEEEGEGREGKGREGKGREGKRDDRIISIFAGQWRTKGRTNSRTSVVANDPG
jgi:hypothetical protein